MKILTNFFTILLLSLSLSVTGQNHFVGLKGGVNLNNRYTSIPNDKTDYSTGFIGGLSYEYKLKKDYTLGIDFLYAQKGYSNKIIFTDDNGNPTGESVAVIFDFDYFSFPMKTGFTFGEKLIGFGNIGIIPSLLTKATVLDPAIEGLTEERKVNITKDYKKFDLGGLIEIGIAYKFGNRLQTFTAIAFNHSFTSITTQTPFESIKMYHYGMSISAGLKYALRKE